MKPESTEAKKARRKREAVRGVLLFALLRSRDASAPCVLFGIRTDRTGILLDLANVISRDFSINIREISIHSHDGIFERTLSLYVKDAESLSIILDKLRKIKGMESVKRNL